MRSKARFLIKVTLCLLFLTALPGCTALLEGLAPQYTTPEKVSAPLEKEITNLSINYGIFPSPDGQRLAEDIFRRTISRNYKASSKKASAGGLTRLATAPIQKYLMGGDFLNGFPK